MMKTPLWMVVVLGFLGFATSFGAHIVAVNLPEYAKEVGVGLAVVGLLISAYDFAELIGKPIFGAVSDHYGMKRTMLLGVAVFTFASFLYPYVSPNLLLLVRFLQGVGAAAFSAVSLALVGVYYTSQRGRAYGIYNTIKGAGYVISPIVGTALVAQSNFAAIFYAVAGIGLFAFLLALLLPTPKEELGKNALDDDDDGKFSIGAMFSVMKQPHLWAWYMVIVVNMFFVGILFGFLPVRVALLNYDPTTRGIILSAAALSYLLVQPLAGILADKASPIKTVQVGLIASGIGIILVPFVSDIPLLLVTIFAGLGIGTVWTNSDAMMSLLAKQGQLGSTMGIAGSFKEFGDMLGPLLIGIIAQLFGLTIGFVTCGVLGIASVILIMGKQYDVSTM